MPLLAAVVAGLAAGSFRFDPSRTLVEVALPFDKFVAVADANRTAFAREDFESVWADRLQLWASTEHLAQLSRSGVAWTRGVDHSAESFAAEVNRTGGRYVDAPGSEPVWTEYCGYNCLTGRMAEMAAEGGCQFPFALINAGETVQGRTIWVAKVGSAGPKVLMAGNIHGDETTGGQLLQRWLWETCHNPTQGQDVIARSVQAFYMPMFNADGFELNQRGNANNQDLNRDFPTPTGDPRATQPETRAYVDLAKSHEFDISLMYHGGAVVCNYPYDSCYTQEIVPRPCPPASTAMHSRHAEVVPSSEAYGDAIIKAGVRCTVGERCLVNGAAWYQIEGSLQDWAFHFRDTLDMTMEVSSTKRVAGSTLPEYYEDHVHGIEGFMMWAARSRADGAAAA